MDKLTNNWQPQMQASFLGGVSTALDDAVFLRPDQLEYAHNADLTGGKLSTRPAFSQLTTLPSGRYQGGSYFNVGGGMLVLSINGLLYSVNISENKAKTAAIHLDLPGNPNASQVYFCETVNRIVIQDGTADPIIFDGSTARRSEASKGEVFRGYMMAYNYGRLWMVGGPNRNLLYAGDIHDSAFPESELQFTETNFLTGGGYFSFPGPITGLAFIPLNDTTTGFGSMFVFGRNFTYSVRAEITSRDMWSQLTNGGFQQLVFPGIGAVGQRSITGVNQDLYWRDGTGHLRSYRTSVVDQSGPGNAPLSQEIRRLLDHDSVSLLDTCSSAYFDNRLMFLASPYINAVGGVSFKDMATLNFSPVALMSGKGPQIYEGEWDGLGFTDIITGTFSGKPRAFVVSTDDHGHNHLWEIGGSSGHDRRLAMQDAAVSIRTKPIKSAAITRKFDWGIDLSLKTLCRMDLFLTDLKGAGSISVFYRKDEDLAWHEWDSWSWDVDMQSSTGPKDIQAQNRAALKTRYPSEVARGRDGLYPYTGYAFQFRFEWTGYCKISRFLIMAEFNRENYSNDRDLVPIDTFADSYTPRTHNYSTEAGNLTPLHDENGVQLHDERFITLTESNL